MIQEISPYKFDNQYKNRLPKVSDTLILCRGFEILMHKNDAEISYPAFRDLPDEILEKLHLHEDSKEQDGTDKSAVFLFSVSNQDFFTLREEILQEISEGLYENTVAALQQKGFDFAPIAVLRRSVPRELCFAGATANQLCRFYKDHQFCGRCGAKTKHDEKERMLRCTKCGNVIYPQICPAVIVGITNGDKLLITRYANQPDKKRLALVAGFTEIGETLEETVQREVFEEVGIHVKNIRYYKCQPWSFTNTLLVGYFCELDGDDKIILQEDELGMAEWFSKEEIEVEFDGVSLTNEMITLFKDGRL